MSICLFLNSSGNRKLGFDFEDYRLPESIPGKDERNEAKNSAPRNDESGTFSSAFAISPFAAQEPSRA
jgi:hypothetical protein